MAKKKEPTLGEQIIGGAIFIIVILGQYLLIFVPIIVFIILIFYSIKWKIQEKKHPYKSIKDFWLDDNEKITFESICSKLANARTNIESLIKQGNNENISKNMDGSFSNRSNRGKEINRELNINNNQYNKSLPRFEYYSSKPYLKWEKLRKTKIWFKSFSFSFIFYVCSFYYFFNEKFSKGILAFYEIILFYFSSQKEFISLKGDEWKTDFSFVMIYSSLISLLGFLIGYFLTKIQFKNEYPEPELVSMSNLKEY